MQNEEVHQVPDYAWNKSTYSWTWLRIAHHALDVLGGTATLRQLYKLIAGHPKTKDRRHWQARLRQVLQGSNKFVRVGRGAWSLEALYSPEQREALRREFYPRRSESKR